MQLTWEGGGMEEELRAWVPHPSVTGAAESLGKHVCLCAFLSEESRLPETISIFIFLGNFAAFISGKIKSCHCWRNDTNQDLKRLENYPPGDKNIEGKRQIKSTKRHFATALPSPPPLWNHHILHNSTSPR